MEGPTSREGTFHAFAMFVCPVFSDCPVSPSAAFHVGVAEDKKTDGVDMFGSPADGDVEFHDADNHSTI